MIPAMKSTRPGNPLKADRQGLRRPIRPQIQRVGAAIVVSIERVLR